ncbi:hypothetical protein C8Q79DRAFT_991477 [Trametes meyenii]|nr:hypothetical protein C8Q79DRAFT_991477 [Trametes meyenii]
MCMIERFEYECYRMLCSFRRAREIYNEASRCVEVRCEPQGVCCCALAASCDEHG